MNILIIGGSGLVGSHLHLYLKGQSFVSKVVATHLSHVTANTVYFNPLEPLSADIIDSDYDVIIHTGALTNVDKCQQEPQLSYELTVISTERLLQLAKKKQAKFVYISTDYVFDGNDGPYREDDQINPLNVYGKHKLEAEMLTREYPSHLIIRITNVYGDEERNKNFISRIVKELKAEEKDKLSISAPSDQFATPVNAADIARAVALLIKDDKHGIYHLAGTDYLSRTQLLQRINVYYNNRIEILPKTTKEMAQSAPRPLGGGLKAEKFLSEYPGFSFSNIDDYLKNI